MVPLFITEYIDLGSDERIQEYNQSYCGAHCLYMIYLIDNCFRIKSALNSLINQVKCSEVYNKCLSCKAKGKVEVNDTDNDNQGTCLADCNVNDNVNQGACFADVNGKDIVNGNVNVNDKAITMVMSMTLSIREPASQMLMAKTLSMVMSILMTKQ